MFLLRICQLDQNEDYKNNYPNGCRTTITTTGSFIWDFCDFPCHFYISFLKNFTVALQQRNSKDKYTVFSE